MKRMFRNWFDRYFSKEEVGVFVIIFLALLLTLVFMGEMLAPVFIALVLAYLLQSLVAFLERCRVPHLTAVTCTFIAFVGLVVTLLVVVMPLAWNQLVNLLSRDLPDALIKIHTQLIALPERYPTLFSEAQVNALLNNLTYDVGLRGQKLITSTLASLPSLVALMVYLVLVPVLIFFMLKDRRLLIDWIIGFLPAERTMMNRVWAEMNRQMMNYVRGKVIEIIIVGLVTIIVFYLLNLRYAMLLGIMVGLSVVIPFIGAALVTIPVALVAYFQFGPTGEFWAVMVIYGVIQALDGNVLVPWLFAEAVNLHPVNIIIAVLLFGGVWGVWGVFFAIPLATLIKAIYNAWPRVPHEAAS